MENSPLNTLSAELLNQVAELVLYRQDGVIITSNDKNRIKNLSAFTNTCREMRQDYAKLYYAINDFTLETECLEFRAEIDAFTKAIGPEMTELMGSMRVVVGIFEKAGEEYPGYSVADVCRAIREGSVKENLGGLCTLSIPELRLKLVSQYGQTFTVLSISLGGVCESLEAAIKARCHEKLRELAAPSPMIGPSFLPPPGVQMSSLSPLKFVQFLLFLGKVLHKLQFT